MLELNDIGSADSDGLKRIYSEGPISGITDTGRSQIPLSSLQKRCISFILREKHSVDEDRE